jgi:hypothetical protein
MDEDELLDGMLAIAKQLAATNDALMAGQYAHLQARIEALIALREPARAA